MIVVYMDPLAKKLVCHGPTTHEALVSRLEEEQGLLSVMRV